MKTATVNQLKVELKNKSSKELIDICLNLSKFKKENKELLTYLLFEAENEAAFIKNVKAEIKEQFESVDFTSYYFAKKNIRKILKNIKTYIRYSKQKQTEVELLLYFCTELKDIIEIIDYNTVIENIYNRQIEILKKRISTLHEDLRYDYGVELDTLLNSE